MNVKRYDAIIIGGGASGLMCAVSAKMKNKNISVAIIEKNDRVGKKLLATGNGRCNLTNKNVSADKFVGSFAMQSRYIFNKYPTERLLNKFESLGLLSCCDKDGRYYPLCKQASAVLDVLRFACERLNVDIFCKENVHSLKKSKDIFSIKTDNNNFSCKKLVLACGSKASPKLGGNGSVGDYLMNFGHSFSPFSPALCPVKVKSDLLKFLKGIRSGCCATLSDSNGKIIKKENGEVQFTENALSGICLFNLSLHTKKGMYILLDLIPNIGENALYNILLAQKERFANQSIDNIFTGIFQKRISQAILKMGGITDFSKTVNQLTNENLESLCKIAKAMRFEVIENSGFDNAQCSKGGVKGKEINEKTMESKKIKGLYICGEAIDICGECGGYNLHFAFSTGDLAGENL